MAKFITAAFIYMVISGALAGFTHNHYHSRCGTTGSMTLTYNDLLWPVAVGVVVTLDTDLYEPIQCNNTIKVVR